MRRDSICIHLQRRFECPGVHSGILHGHAQACILAYCMDMPRPAAGRARSWWRGSGVLSSSIRCCLCPATLPHRHGTPCHRQV